MFSIDERFIDFALFFIMYNRSPKEFTKMLVDGIYGSLGICVTGSMTVAERKRRGVARKKTKRFLCFLLLTLKYSMFIIENIEKCRE